MSKPDPSIGKSRAPRVSRGKAALSANQRVDPPHRVSGDSVAPRGAEAAAPNELADNVSSGGGLRAAEQLQRHAEQIAAHLRARQEELDHREAELNAQNAKLESDTRAARLWVSEHEADLASRCEELAKQQETLAKEQEELAAKQEERRQWEQRRDTMEAQIAEWRQRSSTAPAVADLANQEEAIRRESTLLESRRRKLDEAESRIATAQTDIERIQAELLAERRAFQEEVITIRRQLAEERNAALAEIEKKRQAVRRRSEHVDHCRAAVSRLHHELEKAQCETLEIRLAAEELWAKLSGAAPPAAVTRSLGRTRARLAENHRQMEADLAAQKKEIEGIRVELGEQCARLMERKREIEQWVAAQQADAEEQSARLIAREQELRLEEECLREESRAWRSERIAYQQEIRRLRMESATREEAAAM
jgi:chromosome segregation ATPase